MQSSRIESLKSLQACEMIWRKALDLIGANLMLPSPICTRSPNGSSPAVRSD